MGASTLRMMFDVAQSFAAERRRVESRGRVHPSPTAVENAAQTAHLLLPAVHPSREILRDVHERHEAHAPSLAHVLIQTLQASRAPAAFPLRRGGW
jgi:hypothetical protein